MSEMIEILVGPWSDYLIRTWRPIVQELETHWPGCDCNPTGSGVLVADLLSGPGPYEEEANRA